MKLNGRIYIEIRGVMALGALISSVVLGNPLAPHWINVREAPYSAAGDGVVDDTVAIQSALSALSTPTGGTVYLPPGKYLVTGTLQVPANVNFLGSRRAPHEWSDGGTILLAKPTGPDPFITLAGQNAGIEGITVYYPDQTEPSSGATTYSPTVYPPTIRGGGINNFIKNVTLVNPYDAVDFATNASGRHSIQGLSGQPLHWGIKIDKCKDMGRIDDVHFWPFWSNHPAVRAWQRSNAIAILVADSDWQILRNIFAIGYHVGLFLSSSEGGASNGQAVNLNFDSGNVGIDIYETDRFGWQIQNYNFAAHSEASQRRGVLSHPGRPAYLTISGASFWGTLSEAVRWDADGHLNLNASRIAAPWNGSAAIRATAGNIQLLGNYFTENAAPLLTIELQASVNRSVVTSNELNGNYMSVLNATKQVANNNP